MLTIFVGPNTPVAVTVDDDMNCRVYTGVNRKGWLVSDPYGIVVQKIAKAMAKSHSL